MTAPTQIQLDDFARRLRALEAELGQLRAQSVAPAPTPVPPPAPVPVAAPVPPPVAPGTAWQLTFAQRLLDQGDVRGAVRQLSYEQVRAYNARRSEDLREILELARRARAASSGGTARAAERIVEDTEHSLRALTGGARPGAVTPAAPRPAPAYRQERPAPPSKKPRRQLPEIDVSDLFGARALALVGGIVTLLGIVFFFVLAVNRGWVGPEGRVALGAAASVLVFLTGLHLHRRYGETYSSLAAAGAGIAGGYMTVLAAAALYDLVPDVAALALAGGIAAVGTVTSIVWRSQIVAGLGLIGAMLVPLAVVAQGGLSALGTAFVAVVFAAAAVVALRLGWKVLLIAAAAAGAPQIAALVCLPEYQAQAPVRIVVLAAAFSLLYAAAGVAWQLRSKRAGLDELASSLIAGAAGIAALAAVRLFETQTQEGLALLTAAVAYGAAAAVSFTRRSTRGLSALLAAVAFVLGGFAFADLLSGRPLVFAWAAEAAALSWLARRVDERRFQAWSVVYLALCAGHLLAIEAQPRSLFVETGLSIGAAAASAAVAAAAAAVAWLARPWPERDEGGSLFAALDRLLAGLAARQSAVRSVCFWLAAGFATYALSLAAITLCSSFDWAFVAVTAVWALAGLALGVVGLRTGSEQLRIGPALWLTIVTTAVVLHAGTLESGPRWWSLLVLAGVLFAASVACELLDVAKSAGSMDAAACAAAGASALAAVASSGLLSGQALACTWAAAAAVLAAGAHRLRAPHLLACAALPLSLAVCHALALDAPPRQLVSDVAHPAHGTLTVLAIAAASVASALLAAGLGERRPYAGLSGAMTAFVRGRGGIRSGLLWLGGIAATYAASLGMLAAFTSFDRGWVALAGLWCAIALALVLAGLRLRSTQLVGGGLAWLAATTFTVAAEGAYVLAEGPRCAAYLVVAAALLTGALAYALGSGRDPFEPIAGGATLVSLLLTCYPIATLLGGDAQGLALLGLGALYGTIGAALLRRPGFRDLATLYWATGLALGGTAAPRLLDGTLTVVAWAAASVMLAWLATRAREVRFLVAAVPFLGLALAHALVLESPPSHLFAARLDPGAGAPAVLVAAAALAGVAWFARSVRDDRRHAAWITGVLVVYGVSLAILQLAESVFATGLQAEFQRGQTAVSAFWGLLGLVLLYAGLTRWRSLRLAGLALFALSLGKIFLYDLPSLSSIERALSFLAVGAVLMLGGFFYQRLAAGKAEPVEADPASN